MTSRPADSPVSRREFLVRQALFGLSCGIARPLLGDESPTAAPSTATAATETSVARGLTWLATRQRDDGSFGSGGYLGNVAVTALAGMALTAAGNNPGRGLYGATLDRTVGFLLDHARPSGFIIVEDAASHGPMYGHGFATLFLSESYGMTQRADIRSKLSHAVELIIGSQNDQGGWRYHPVRRDADVSVTICQIMALRAARNAGLFVPRKTVDRCIDYVKRCQNPDGGFRYMLEGGQSAFARSAAGVVALYNAGIYRGPEIQNGLNYVMRFLPGEKAAERTSHFFYGHYYAIQAMWQAGDAYWQAWHPAIQQALLERQRKDGAWSDPICAEYGTAMALLVLQMPNRLLPIFQK
ncbi:MAG: prenyltransferase/squalene oxidase repeat-containing protein [Pirellulales bacterium]